MLKTISIILFLIGLFITIIGFVIYPNVDGAAPLMIENFEVTSNHISNNYVVNSNTIALFGTLISVFGISLRMVLLL